MSRVISVENLSKTYRLGTIGGGSLNEDLARWWARLRGKPDPAIKADQPQQARRIGERFAALSDVNFEVAEGEVLGVIGRNGAGKSTLLKVLSQVTAPTSGRIRIRGRVASLLEVGTGFHPDLTGRENVYLNGAIMGMTKAEIRQKFDEIVAFSECEEFIDTPVKRYSSGMYVRLAFAVAAHLEPEILIVDEVLAVGDAQFQKKCLGKMGAVSRDGRTIIFVSHSMPAVSALCTRAMLFRDGRLALAGDVGTVIAGYQSDSASRPVSAQNVAELPRAGTGKAIFTSLETKAVNGNGIPLDVAITGCDVLITTTLVCYSPFRDANVGIDFCDATGYRIIDANLAINGEFLTMRPGETASITFHMRQLLLKPGVYQIGLWVGRAGTENIDWVQNAGQLEVHEDIASTKHTETFPGVYYCQFGQSVRIEPSQSQPGHHSLPTFAAPLK